MRVHKNRLKTSDYRTIKPTKARYAARAQAEPFQRFYGTAEWQRTREAVITERGRRCEDCGATPVRLFVDHIRELRDGGAPHDPRNLRVRCGACHAAKTAAVRTERAGGAFDDEG